REAAQFLLDRPEYLARILAACPHIFGWEKDDKFGDHEIAAELRWVRNERARLPASPAPTPCDPGKGPPTAPIDDPPTAPVDGGCPAPPPTDEGGCAEPTPAPTPCRSSLESILNAPGLSIEEKLRRVLM